MRMIDSKAGLAVLCAAAVFGALGAAKLAAAQSADCARLRQAISDAARDNQGAQYQAAADRQRAEIDRTSAYAHSIGCDHRQFLFFGSPPPPQCGQINAQIGRMQANLAELQSRASGAGGRAELIARYNAQCVNSGPPNFLAALFGGVRSGPGGVETVPLNPDATQEKPLDANPEEARAGSLAVCVRTCDGSFFPVSYSASAGRLQGLEDMCRALCPNADVSLYTYPASGGVEQAVSISGARYMDSPNALKYRQSFDSACSCRRRGESWAEALAGAETKLGREFEGRYFRHAGEIGGNVAAEARPQGEGGEARGDARGLDHARDPQSPERRRRRGPQSEPAGGDHQPRSVGHRRRRSANGRPLRRGAGPDGRGRRPRRRQATRADNRSDALTRPMSGSSAASSGPASRPVSASRKG